MAIIIDKRFIPKNTAAKSRKKFIDRYKDSIKKSVKDLINKDSIKDFDKSNKKIKIKGDGLTIPHFDFEPGTGDKDMIHVGNRNMNRGQKVKKPQDGQSQGNNAGNDGEGQDEFEFLLTNREYADLFFEDLELPEMIKKQFLNDKWETQHAGYSNTGGPSALCIKKTMLKSISRRTALKCKECDGKGEISLYSNTNGIETEQLIKCHKCNNKKVLFIDDIDLKYNYRDKVDVPTSKAVMFCLMDVSGSMGSLEKDLAKRFYLLLYLFIKKNYEKTDVVFVRHTTEAEEVDEETFFYDRLNGGTMVSSGYELVDSLIKERYPADNWNIYIAQASDGDNWDEDNMLCQKILTEQLLPATQYFAYLNVGNMGRNSFYFNLLKELSAIKDNLHVKAVREAAEIYPVFRELFQKGKK